VIAFLEHLAARDRLDLDACGEFLVLISALLELKARGLFPDEEAELAELEPEEGRRGARAPPRRVPAGEGGRRVARERLEEAQSRFFRLGPAPLQPARPEPELGSQSPESLAEVIRALAVEPPAPSTAHMALAFPPLAQFLERWRSLLRRRTRLDFDQETAGFSRVEIAVAFLALLELAKQRELDLKSALPVVIPSPVVAPLIERAGGTDCPAIKFVESVHPRFVFSIP